MATEEFWPKAAEKVPIVEADMTKPSKIKAALNKYSRPFNGDKQQNESEKIKVLRSEICRILNDFIEHYKGIPCEDEVAKEE